MSSCRKLFGLTTPRLVHEQTGDSYCEDCAARVNKAWNREIVVNPAAARQAAKAANFGQPFVPAGMARPSLEDLRAELSGRVLQSYGESQAESVFLQRMIETQAVSLHRMWQQVQGVYDAMNDSDRLNRGLVSPEEIARSRFGMDPGALRG